ncbi:hypothetical protein MSAN_00513800 [Mycena sanguinolenta]|uniref:Uncharacterized protein n=1 Tax=Mycena sanguinolenta TaxID=230812 RepID=A0A8H7DIZ2_9AGAR|nr:hypothetical protein MSAN_00513800 [Mycena sanguinolenta]
MAFPFASPISSWRLPAHSGVPYSTPVSDHSKDAAPYVRNGMELGREAQYTLPWASYPVLWLTDSGGTVDEVPGIIIYYLFWDDNASAWELSVQFEDAESGAEYVFIPRRGAGGSIKPTKNGWYTLQYKASEPTIVRVEIRPQ